MKQEIEVERTGNHANGLPFAQTDLNAYFEIARRALADADLFDEMAEQLDLSDAQMVRLREQLAAYMEREAGVAVFEEKVDEVVLAALRRTGHSMPVAEIMASEIVSVGLVLMEADICDSLDRLRRAGKVLMVAQVPNRFVAVEPDSIPLRLRDTGQRVGVTLYDVPMNTEPQPHTATVDLDFSRVWKGGPQFERVTLIRSGNRLWCGNAGGLPVLIDAESLTVTVGNLIFVADLDALEPLALLVH